MNAGIAVMLLGSIGFMMGIFYLVNHSDKQMVLYTWKVICATISIFASVLIYQAFNVVVQDAFLEGKSETAKMQVAFVHCFIWFLLLQALLATVSRAITWPCQNQEELKESEKIAVAKTMNLDLKCWATILGHITGFATISAWAQVQQMMARELIGGAILVLPLAFATLELLFWATDYLRHFVALWDDGTVDRFEELWDEATEETEDDVMGLTLSFLLVQVLRYYVSGVLPNDEGDWPEDFVVTNLQVFILILLGAGIAVLSFWRTVYVQQTFGRYTAYMRLVCDFSFCWSMMFAVDAFLASHGLGGIEYGCLGEVITACILTICAFCVIYLLDKQADMMEEEQQRMAHESFTRSLSWAEKKALHKRQGVAIRSTVMALGVLIGFAWEKCFDVAVDATAEKEAKILPAAFTKMVLAFLLATIVIPAWRWYILPVVQELGGFEEEGEEEAEEGEDAEQKAYIPPKLTVTGELEALEQQLQEQSRLSQRLADLQAQKAQRSIAELTLQLQAKTARVAELEERVGRLGA
eukprot:TRINITY_DN80562_c0_g1_i1.p1 TRINITY_DN80562_c0_g1~~TRINITY_DN80562_c0_g1_i1.p1  ORF type:complete len:572 (+),score=171.53 TRINITY_DN80562_c0_g1_i1:140-1717(+)